jgi:hypothetical protein
MATMVISTAAQKNEFLSRLNRIESGIGSSKSTLYVGLDETIMADSKQSEKLKKQAAAIPAKPLGMFGIVVSLISGLLAVGTALYLRFLMTGEAGPQDNVDMTMAVNGGVALAIALFAGFMLKMPLGRFAPVAVIGVLAGVVGFHNLVHLYPAQFAEMFSPVWVEQVVNTTPANSIIWRGQTYVM